MIKYEVRKQTDNEVFKGNTEWSAESVLRMRKKLQNI